MKVMKCYEHVRNGQELYPPKSHIPIRFFSMPRNWSTDSTVLGNPFRISLLWFRRPLYLPDKNRIHKLHKLWHRRPDILRQRYESIWVDMRMFCIFRFLLSGSTEIPWVDPSRSQVVLQVREIMVQTTAEAPVTMNTAVNQVREGKWDTSKFPATHLLISN